MINCAQCKEEISEEARTCPQCGQPQFYTSTLTNVIVMLIASFIFIGAILHFLGFESQRLDVYAGIGALILTTLSYKKRKVLN